MRLWQADADLAGWETHSCTYERTGFDHVRYCVGHRQLPLVGPSLGIRFIQRSSKSFIDWAQTRFRRGIVFGFCLVR